jgi:diguanylate cyclase (GGDEF)-like protein/PAS domain S-box-containing protein
VPGDADSQGDVAFQLNVRERALLATGVAFSVADARADDTPLVWVNPAFTAMTGYTEAEVLGRNCRFLQGPGTDPAHVAALRTGLDSGEDVTVTVLNYRKDGSEFWNQCTLSSVYDAADGRTHYVGIQVDVTARVVLEADLAAAESRYRLLAENSSDIISYMDLDGTLRYISPAYERVLGWACQDVIGTKVAVGPHPDDTAAVYQAFTAAVAGEPSRVTFRSQRSNGTWAWLEAHAHPLRDPATGAITGVQAATRDISDRRDSEAKLERLALSDSLTGLANRALLTDRLGHAQQRLQREPGCVALLMLDLDRFKLVNDSLGHHVGDLLLIEVADRLRHCVRPTDTVARLGGDEFVVLLEYLTGQNQAVAAAERILTALREPLTLPTHEAMAVRGSIGIATTTDPNHPADALFREADLALYHAKDQGRDRYSTFDVGLRQRVLAQVSAERQVRRGLAGNGLRLHYQPILRLADNIVTGAEALVRLHDPDSDRLIGPDGFIEAAEDSGLISEIDQWVMNQAMRDLVYPSAGRLGADIAINVSPRSMLNPRFAERFTATADNHGIDASRLLVEVTERTLMDTSGISLHCLIALRALGVRVGIDDFGTGYSSLGYLQRLPLDFVKIDRSFVAQLPTSGRAAATVEAIITLAHAHDLTVTAEGIENQDQLDTITELGCDYGQGYFIGRPASLTRTEDTRHEQFTPAT